MVLACQNLSSAQLTVSRKGNLSRDAVGREGGRLFNRNSPHHCGDSAHSLSLGRSAVLCLGSIALIAAVFAIFPRRNPYLIGTGGIKGMEDRQRSPFLLLLGFISSAPKVIRPKYA